MTQRSANREKAVGTRTFGTTGGLRSAGRPTSRNFSWHNLEFARFSSANWALTVGAVQGCGRSQATTRHGRACSLAVLIARLSGNEQTAIDVARGSSWQNLDIGVNPAADRTGAIELLNQAQSDSAPSQCRTLRSASRPTKTPIRMASEYLSR